MNYVIWNLLLYLKSKYEVPTRYIFRLQAKVENGRTEKLYHNLQPIKYFHQSLHNNKIAFPIVSVYTDQPVSSASPPTRDKINGEEKARSRRRDTWAEPSTPPVTDDGKSITRELGISRLNDRVKLSTFLC